MNDTVKKLVNKYRGLKKEDLCEMNPWYSCMICGNKKCKNHNKPKCSCPRHIAATEEEFAMYYNFS